MKQTEFIAALVLGTSKMTAMAGRKNEQNNIISIIAAEKEDSENCIRRACVYNVEETANKITKLIHRLNSRLPAEIDKLYIGIGGQSLRTQVYSVSKDVPYGIISEDIIQSLFDECKNYTVEFAEILDIVSPEYFLDGRAEMNPVGVQCSKIEAKFKLILGKPSLKRTLEKSIREKAGIEIAGYFVAPIATASAVLTDTEKELGCALIEFGAGITYLSIYKNKLLKFLVAIPIGGKVITKDICDLNILEKEAEELKVKFGSALTEFDNNVRIETAKLAEGMQKSREVELNKLNNIIESRMDEILANVFHQIEESGFSQSLGSGIIITGGGAALKNLTESIKNKCKHEVRTASVKKSLVNQAPEISQEYGNEEVIGLLALGDENCAKFTVEVFETHEPAEQKNLFDESEIEKIETPQSPKQEKKKSGGLFRKLTNKFDGFSKSLFDEDGDE